MKIQIVQAEIEAAIRQYIGEQITIKEGMQIDIDLRSTRGDAGFTADIDITPAKQAKPPVTKAEAAVTKSVASVEPKREEPAAQDASQGKEEEAQPQPEPESTAGVAAEDGPASDASAEPASTEPQPEAAEQPAEAPKKSLFKNLARVTNS